MKDIAIYGAGGFGRESACVIRSINEVKEEWNIIGFFDDNEVLKGSVNAYGEVLGGLEELNSWGKPLAVLIAIGNASSITKVLGRLDNPNIYFPNIIAPDVRFLDRKSTTLGRGNLIGFRCILSCDVCLGDFNLFNSEVVIGHDATLGNFNMLNPAVRISGEVSVGNSNFFGICSIVLQQKKIGDHTTIAANSVIMRNTDDNCMYIGNPAIKVNL